MPTVDECRNSQYKSNNWDACDQTMSNHCKSNPGDLDLCGCSANAFQKIPDPKMGMLNPKCWSQTCSTNATAYRFKFNDDKCPQVCVDNSTINALGSNIVDSKFKQSNCGSQDIEVDDTKSQEDMQQLKNALTMGGIGLLVLIICSISLSLLILFMGN
jgi:hypothetical protein